MGIKGLPKLIKDIADGAAIRSYKFSKFRDMPISIDASLMIHQTVVAMRSNGHDMKNKKGELTSHLHGIFYKVLIFLQNHMVPIFVFDGKAPDIKNKTIGRRKEKKSAAAKILENLSDSEDEEYIKNFKQTFSPTKDNIREAQILLDLMGIPYIVAPGEADVVCAWLAARKDSNGNRYATGVCSDDSDMLALGAPYLFKDMLRFMRKNKPVKVISLKKTLEKMKITMDQFVDLCVLLGTDYCENIKNIGPKTAYRLILKKGSLKQILASTDKSGWQPEDYDNEKCMLNASDYFKNALPEIDKSTNFVITDDQLKLKRYQYQQLMDFMCAKHNFDPVRVQTGINRLEQYYNEMGVTRPNDKQVHKLIYPEKSYIVKTIGGDVDFDSSDNGTASGSDEETMPSKKNPLINLVRKKSESDSDISVSPDASDPEANP